jgi:protein MpaA
VRRLAYFLVPLVLFLAVGCTSGSTSGSKSGSSAGPTGPATSSPPTLSPRLSSASPSAVPPADPSPVPSPAGCLRTVVVGYSVRHRAITACERGTRGGTALVVVGNVHGDETLGWRVVDRLLVAPVPAGVDLWLIRSANPDGSALHTRGNAHGVDENRNWPTTWQPSAAGSATYSGPRPWSEPETAALGRWLLSLKPRTVVVFHTPLNAVDFSEGADPAVTRYLARASGFAARRLGARPGSLSGWFNGLPWGGGAIVFELGRTATPAQLSRVSDGLLALARWRAGG